MTNCNNIFGTTLIENIMGNYNILRLLPHKTILDRANEIDSVPYTYHTCKIECIPYTYSKIENGKFIDNITDINKVIDHANNTYGGIDICIDCKEGPLNEIDLQTLLLHHSVIQNNTTEINKCKIIYNNNEVKPCHINLVYPSNAAAYNCNNSVQTAIDIIENVHKFSTNSGSPYFDFDKYEGKYSPLLYF